MGRESTTGAADPGLRLDAGHRLRPRGRAHRLRALHPRDRRARRRRDPAGRDLLAERRQQDRQRRRPRLPRGRACSTTKPASPDEAFSSYAKNSAGERAIFRMPIRTGPQPSLCTAHVFHQIPGQNRIFMGWYSQGTHVIDFEERPERDDRLPRGRPGSSPQNANEWVSAVFKVDRNPDGTLHLLGRDRRLQPRRRAATRSTSTRSRCRRRPPRPHRSSRAPGRASSRPAASPAARASAAAASAACGSAHAEPRCAVARAVPPAGAARVWRYCVSGDRRGRVLVVFGRRGRVRLVASTARRHRARGPCRRGQGPRPAAGPTGRPGAAPARTVRVPHQSGPGPIRRRRRRPPRPPARRIAPPPAARSPSVDSATRND